MRDKELISIAIPPTTTVCSSFIISLFTNVPIKNVLGRTFSAEE